MATVGLALAVGGYLYLRLDDEIRRFAHAVLTEQYPGHSVTIGRASYAPGEGVTLSDVRLHDAGVGNASEPQLFVGEVRLDGDFDLQHLARGRQRIRGVLLREPRLRLTKQADGRWDSESLLPTRSAGGPMPRVTIENGTVSLHDPERGPTPLVLGPINAVAGPAPDDTAPGRSAASSQSNSASPIAVTATVGGTLARSLELQGRVSLADGSFNASLKFDELRITDELLATLPLDCERPEQLRLELRSTGTATVERKPGSALVAWSSDFRVIGGNARDPRLPRPLSEIAATVHMDQDQLQVAKLTAQLGEAQLSAAGAVREWSTASAAASWRVAGMKLDDKLYRSLPRPLQDLWNRYRPAGAVDATGSLTCRDGRLLPDVTVTCQGVSFEDHRHFPYRLANATGALRYRDPSLAESDAQLDVNLLADGEGRAIRISAELRELPGVPPLSGGRSVAMPNAMPIGWIEIRGDSLRVTDALVAALPARAEQVARDFAPRGEFSAKWRMEKTTAATPATTTTLIKAKGMSAEYRRFPYPLRRITGELHEQNGRWWFQEAVARGAGEQSLTASGVLLPPSPETGGKHEFRMRASGGVPLDETLRAALPNPAQQAWEEVRPRGRVDFTADVRARGDEEPRIELVAAPHRRDLAIEPKSFPYRMENIDGRFTFADNRLTFTKARANHGRTQIEGAGAWTRTPQGGWRLEVNSLAVDRLDADHDFRLAAPIGLRRVIGRVDPEGSFSVNNGRITLVKPSDTEAISAEWDMEFDFHQADLNGGLQIEDATGAVRLAGRSQQGKTVCIGELQVDALFWNGLQLTNVRGPIWCDDQLCLLGADAAVRQQGNRPDAQPRSVTCQAYGGVASLNAQVLFGRQPRYGAAVSFEGVNLERFTKEYGHATTPLAGKLAGSLELRGLGATVYGLGGGGELHVTEADFGELPILVALFKALRGQAPDKTAFDRCDARFRMQGEHVSFDQLNLYGNAVSLEGTGEARLDKTLDLTFHSILARNEFNAPMLRALVGQASQQLLTIRVGGTVNDPLVRRETLPLVGNVLRQFQQQQQGADSSGDTAPAPARRY